MRCLDEVRVGYSGRASLEQWANLLAPAKREGDIWFVGNGPALHLVPSQENHVEAIVLKAESLEKARAVLTEKKLLGKLTPDGIELNPTRTFGLRIFLKEE